jgi:hypothetical protein
MAFTRAFYVAFLSGKTVKASFDIAKEALKLSPYVPDSMIEGDKFILLPEVLTAKLEGQHQPLLQQQPSVEQQKGGAKPPVNAAQLATAGFVDYKYHEKALFANRISIDWPLPGQCTIGANRTDLKIFLSRIRIPSPPADFEGREVIMNNIIRNILDRKFISLVGEDGVGKSAVAGAICKYMADREYFTDAIIYLKLKGIKDYSAFLIVLKNALLASGNNNVTRKMQELLHQQHHHHGSTSSSTSSSSSHSSNTSVSSASSTSSMIVPYSANAIALHSASSAVYNQISTVDEEEMIIAALESMKALLVFDHLDDLLSDFGDAVTYLRLFLHRLFEQCAFVKILNVSTDTLSMYNIYVGSGIVEYSISLGPLTLYSTLRLFARLAPSLTTIHEKLEFIDCLQPPRQYHVTIHSREITNAALQILTIFGEGHPAKIVHMACESNSEKVEELKRIGKRIIQQSLIPPPAVEIAHHNIIIG